MSFYSLHQSAFNQESLSVPQCKDPSIKEQNTIFNNENDSQYSSQFNRMSIEPAASTFSLSTENNFPSATFTNTSLQMTSSIHNSLPTVQMTQSSHHITSIAQSTQTTPTKSKSHHRKKNSSSSTTTTTATATTTTNLAKLQQLTNGIVNQQSMSSIPSSISLQIPSGNLSPSQTSMSIQDQITYPPPALPPESRFNKSQPAQPSQTSSNRQPYYAQVPLPSGSSTSTPTIPPYSAPYYNGAPQPYGYPSAQPHQSPYRTFTPQYCPGPPGPPGNPAAPGPPTGMNQYYQHFQHNMMTPQHFAPPQPSHQFYYHNVNVNYSPQPPPPQQQQTTQMNSNSRR